MSRESSFDFAWFKIDSSLPLLLCGPGIFRQQGAPLLAVEISRQLPHWTRKGWLPRNHHSKRKKSSLADRAIIWRLVSSVWLSLWLFSLRVLINFHRPSQCRKVVLLQCAVRYRQMLSFVFQFNPLTIPIISDLGKAANFPYATIKWAPRFTSNLILLKLNYTSVALRHVFDSRRPAGPFMIPWQEARIPVPDARFEWLCETYKPVSRVPAFLTCIDIAGLTAVYRPPALRRFIVLTCSYRAHLPEQVWEILSYPTFVLSMESSKSSAHLMMLKSSMSRAT